MATRFEGSLNGKGSTEIFFQLWSVEQPRGTIVLTHGLAEHSDCYADFAKSLQGDGWEVYGWDMRGHGRSAGKRGYVVDFSDYTDDLQIFIDYIHKERKNKTAPLILFGHSMGGLVTTVTALQLKKTSPVTAICLASPLFGVAMQVSAIKDQAARLAAKWWPTLTLHNDIRYTDLTRDEEMYKSYEHDVLRHDRISPGLYLGILQGCEMVQEQAPSLTLPVLLQVAGVDRIVSTAAAQEIFARLPNKKNVMELYPESLHEIYNDLDHEQAMADLKHFINKFTGSEK